VSIARNLAPDQQVDVRLTALYFIDNRFLMIKNLDNNDHDDYKLEILNKVHTVHA